MQRIQSNGCKFVTDIWSGHVRPGPKRQNLFAVGADRRSLSMDLLVTIVQIVKDLLGSLNPFRLLGPDYRVSFRNLWRQESRIFRVGYVLGALGLLVLLGLVALLAWQYVKA